MVSTKETVSRLSTKVGRRPVGLVVSLAGVVIALSSLVIGCGDAGNPGPGPAEGGSTVTSTRAQLPPIDLLAPAAFETASFALG